MTTTPTASISHLQKAYGDRLVVDDVSFDLNPGEVTVLVGPNGSGKTTTMEMIAGLRRPTNGSTTIAGIPVTPGGLHRALIGMQLQTAGVPGHLKAKELLAATTSLYAQPLDWRPMAETLHLTEHLNTYAEKLSGGQRRKLDVINACIGSPKLLLLDEPTSGVDPEGRAELWKFIRESSHEGTTILASTHDMAEAETYADNLLLMVAGKIHAEGPFDQVLAQFGGEWRLRIEGLPAELKNTIEGRGHQFLTIGDVTVVFGNAEEMKALSRDIQDSIPAHARHVHVSVGPVRLEDIFLTLTGGSHV